MTMNTLKCSYCGVVNLGNASYCTHCGRGLHPLRDRYHIIEEISYIRGASSIYKAEDIECFNRIVAIKKFQPKNPTPEARYEAQKMCEREVQMLSKLNHHAIPTIYDYFSNNESWFLVMNFIEGETLEERWQRTRRSSRLTVEEIITIGIELCDVLYYLHHPQRAIVFRDLKPSNVMLDRNKHLYLIDFGSAQYLNTTQTSDLLVSGTPGYAAPELFQGHYSPRSDIYSLGEVLYQLVSGKRPSGSTNSIREKPEASNRMMAHIPAGLSKVISQMVADDENDRPLNVTDIQKELQQIRHQLATPTEIKEPPHLSRRSIVVGGVIAGAGLTIGGTVALWSTFRPPIIKNSPKVVPFPLVIGGKLDDEAALLTEMYALLLQNAGFSVADKVRLGTNDIVFSAIKIGAIDLYPEFLLTGLSHLSIPTTRNQQQDFLNVQQGFASKYQITWLDQAVHLDDNYAVVMQQAFAKQIEVKTLSDLARVYRDQKLNLTIAVAPDGQTLALPPLKSFYGITFKDSNTLSMDEKQTFSAVMQGTAQINICIATDPLIALNNFVRLIDDKNAFPVDTPSPIVRSDVLRKAPLIATVLNKLAPRLSVDVSTQLQAQMLQGQSAREVARSWLTKQKLLSSE